eukprot:gene17256-biopygen5323
MSVACLFAALSTPQHFPWAGNISPWAGHICPNQVTHQGHPPGAPTRGTHQGHPPGAPTRGTHQGHPPGSPTSVTHQGHPTSPTQQGEQDGGVLRWQRQSRGRPHRCGTVDRRFGVSAGGTGHWRGRGATKNHFWLGVRHEAQGEVPAAGDGVCGAYWAGGLVEPVVHVELAGLPGLVVLAGLVRLLGLPGPLGLWPCQPGPVSQARLGLWPCQPGPVSQA